MSNRKEWVKNLKGNDSITEAARKANITPSTLNRQLASGNVTADSVISLALGYGRSCYWSLVETGFIPETDIDITSLKSGFEHATDLQLATEVLRRMSHGTETQHLFETELELQVDSEQEKMKLHLAAHDPGDDIELEAEQANE